MEAYLYQALKEDTVRCRLCAHYCVVRKGGRGICGVRENRDGRLHTRVYGRLVARHVDPIEKKPLFHLLPGSLSYSVATVGCNFRCRFCQNADIAQMPADRGGAVAGERCAPEAVVAAAERNRCRSIAYTYTEPTVFFEFAHDTAKIAHERGIRNVFVTNGFMSAEALETIRPFLDAANVDLKAFNDDFYRTVCGARRDAVMATLRRMKAFGILVEVTTLIVPGLNDDEGELTAMARFLADDLGPETPWHLSRFHPTYRLTDRPATPVKTLLKARDIGMRAGLRYVYTGNVPGEASESTYCHHCGELLVQRVGFRVVANRVEGGRCPDCATAVYGVSI